VRQTNENMMGSFSRSTKIYDRLIREGEGERRIGEKEG
jgi:hypothetical protein